MAATSGTWGGKIDEVQVRRDGNLGRIRLNRPRALNSLSLAMVDTITDQLETWAADDAVAAVAIEGGDRGLCAGGDIKAIYQNLKAGTDTDAFWHHEYRLNALIAEYPKPFAALMSGIVMGGGLGLSAHASLRLVTATTQAAMPETGIGFFPDVGVRYELSRAPGQLGTHMALTGTVVGAGDAIALGLADACIEPGQWPAICERLARGDKVTAAIGTQPDSPLGTERAWIDECYPGDDPAAIVRALEAHPAEAARAAGKVLRTRSPLSVAVTLHALREAERASSITEVTEADVPIAQAFMGRSDFLEGVRAKVVDKDNQPRWLHDRIEEVTAAEVERFFQ